MIKFIPKSDMVLVKVSQGAEKSEGGIILPDQARKKPDEGTVVCIGPDVRDTKLGDKVLFGKYVGVFLDIKGIEGELLLHESDLLGTLKEEA